MAIQKHNTYYDASKPNSGIYFYDQNGNSKQLPIDKICSAGKGIDLIDNTITYTGKDEPVLIGDSNITATSSTSGNHTQWNLFVNPTPIVTDTSLTGENGITAHTTDVSGQWIIGLETNSANYIKKIPNILEDVDALTSKSANWESSYNTLKSNSGDWLKEDALTSLATKSELNTVNSVLTAQTDYLSGVINNKLDTSAFNTYTANADITPYSGIDPILVKDHKISLNAEYALSSAVYSKDEVYNKDEIDGFVDDISAEFIKYLNKTDFNTYSADVKTQIDAKLDTNTFDAWSAHAFDDYAKSADVNEKFNQTSAWAKDTFQPKGEYVSASEFNNLADIVNDIVEDVTELDNTKLDTSAFNNYSAHALDDYYNKSKVDELVDNAIDDLSATVENEYAKKTDIHEYTAGPNIEINDYEVSGRDWTPELDEKADTTFVEQVAETLANEIAKKLDTSAFDNYSAHALDNYYNKTELNNRFEPIETDIDILKTYSAHNTVESSNDYINVQSGANKFILTFTSGDLATKTWVESALADFGGFEPAEPTGEDKHPDVTNPDNKKIYLVADNIAPNPDKSREWIVTGANTSTGWYCIGDTSLDLDPYLTKNEAAQTYQLKGDYLSANAFDNLSGNWESTYDTVNSNSATWEKVNDLYNVELSSTNDSIGITATTAVDGTVKYDLSVDKVTLPDISGENGISAYFDENESKYVVGLENYNDIGFAKYSTNSNTYTTSAVVTGYQEDLNVNPTKITLTNDQILLKKGFYHVDVQTNFAIRTVDNNYYDVMIKSIPNAASITQMIDTSYTHTETVDLSFDVRITNDDTPIEISVENYKSGETFAISNLNIHEIVSMPSQIQGGANNYQAGDAIDITNDTLSVKFDSTSGIGLNANGQLVVKLGKGLAFDTSGAAAGQLSIDDVTEEVVDTVQTISDDLDTKVTTNFPPAMIIKTDCDIAEYRGAGALYGNLFNVSINSVVEIDRTMIGVYVYQVDNDKNVILGLYEYQPDYPRYNNEDSTQGISGYGRTVALCDTGVITIPQGTVGFCEYPIKNLNNTIGTPNEETKPSLKSSCMYYATIFMGSDMNNDGLKLYGVTGYAPQVNQIKPGLNICPQNYNLALNDAAYSGQISFNDFGFGWKYDNYVNHYTQGDTTTASISYQEKSDGNRFYMQIRNKPQTSNI